MTPTTEKQKAAPAAGVDELEAKVAELTAKVEELEALAARNVETFVSSTDFEQALETVVPAKVAEAIQAALDEAAKPLLDQLEEKLEEITAAAGVAVGDDVRELVQWAHARISALQTGVQRGIGILIDLPGAPGAQNTGDVNVVGAETTDRLGG